MILSKQCTFFVAVAKVVKRVPVLAGVCASDPFRRMDRFLVELERLGFDGIQNFPTVGLIDGNFRQNLEETGMGYGYVAHFFGLSLCGIEY